MALIMSYIQASHSVIRDGEQSYEFTTTPPTFPPSNVPTLALEDIDPDKDFENQVGISSNFEPGRPLSSSTTLPIFREVEVNIPQFDYVDDYAIEGYADDYIVDEHAFNSPSLHDENHFLLSHLNVYSPCTEHESEPVVDIVSTFAIDSCSEGISKAQPVTLGLGKLTNNHPQ
ncbi:hypothetical protein LR48_Vigan348s000100 [Vigna angularis]|uniref:Uncharacterized protein n=1 Tax=Phaseolus angularis TaxID=3914 RepID=A0A0L9TA61_PHAAN|nr:hypothetical protein LR48_Vigan348s000100 [Vigna angularis]